MQHSAAESRVMSLGDLYDESQACAWLSATPPCLLSSACEAIQNHPGRRGAALHRWLEFNCRVTHHPRCLWSYQTPRNQLTEDLGPLGDVKQSWEDLSLTTRPKVPVSTCQNS